MTYLVDANVLCEPTRPAPDAKVVAWLSAHEGDYVVDAIVLAEIQMGIIALPRSRKRAALEQWFAGVVQRVECLPWDATVGLRWTHLVVELQKKGQAMPTLDSMIAATALTHNLTVATQNTRDFNKAGIKVFDPFE